MNKFEGMSDKESYEYQLARWIEGEPIHNPIKDECCPDFSCCTGNIAPIDQRQRFAKAVRDKDECVEAEMLGMFLGAYMRKAYIAGLKIPSEC